MIFLLYVVISVYRAYTKLWTCIKLVAAESLKWP